MRYDELIRNPNLSQVEALVKKAVEEGYPTSFSGFLEQLAVSGVSVLEALKRNYHMELPTSIALDALDRLRSSGFQSFSGFVQGYARFLHSELARHAPELAQKLTPNSLVDLVLQALEMKR